MDIYMKNTNTGVATEWDFALNEDGDAIATVDGKEEAKQQAIIAAFLQKGTIPQLPDTGNPHAELLLDQVAPNEYQHTMMDNIKNLGDSMAHTPVFVAKGGKLMVEVLDN